MNIINHCSYLKRRAVKKMQKTSLQQNCCPSKWGQICTQMRFKLMDNQTQHDFGILENE